MATKLSLTGDTLWWVHYPFSQRLSGWQQRDAALSSQSHQVLPVLDGPVPSCLQEVLHLHRKQEVECYKNYLYLFWLRSVINKAYEMPLHSHHTAAKATVHEVRAFVDQCFLRTLQSSKLWGLESGHHRPCLPHFTSAIPPTGPWMYSHGGCATDHVTLSI